MTMSLGASPLARTQHSNEIYTDLLSFCFDGPAAYDGERPLFIDAEAPSCSFSAWQFRTLVQTLIAGLKVHHIQRGDCVLVHLDNNVSCDWDVWPNEEVPRRLNNSCFPYLTPPPFFPISFFFPYTNDVDFFFRWRSYTPHCSSVSSVPAACSWDLMRAVNLKN
jgi:hypothetical protein